MKCWIKPSEKVFLAGVYLGVLTCTTSLWSRKMERHCYQEHFIFMQHVWRDELKFLSTSLRKTDLIEKLGKKKLGEGKGSRYHVKKHAWRSVDKHPHCQSAGELGHLIIQIVSNLQWFWFRIFQLYKGEKAICIQKKPYFRFEFSPFPGLAICCRILSHDAGQRQWDVFA